jgi:cytochrome b involved in lipid metabolism
VINSWLEGKRTEDNAETLWRVHDKIYDLTNFIKLHPGGNEWIELTKGCDITEQFEVHHIDEKKVNRILEKYYVRDAKHPRNYKFTFAEDGFYRTLKRRVAEKLKHVDQKPAKTSKIICDLIVGMVFVTSILAIKDRNIYLAILSGIFVHWLSVISHNFFHQKDNWRMMTFNLCLMNFRDWRVSHAMSHHIYTNTYYDMEISMFEPFLQWLPRRKTNLYKIIATVISPIVWTVMIFVSAVNR